MKLRYIIYGILFLLSIVLLIINRDPYSSLEKAFEIDDPKKLDAVLGVPTKPKLLTLPRTVFVGKPKLQSIDLTVARPRPDQMLPSLNAQSMQEMAKKVGIQIIPPPNVDIFGQESEGGRLQEIELYFKDDPKLGLAVYIYKGAAGERDITEFLQEETGTTLDDWENAKNLGNLKEKGFGDELTLEMYNPDNENSKFIVYASAPGDRHIAFVAFGNHDAIEAKYEALYALYNSLKVLK